MENRIRWIRQAVRWVTLAARGDVMRAVWVEGDDTEVTLKRNPKTDGLRRATQKADMKCKR